MEAIEKAIRNALEKGDARNRAFREKVYRSAHAALERALSGKENIPPEFAETRRESLISAIKDIESEFEPALPAEPVPTATTEAEAEVQPEQVKTSKAPPVEIEPRPQPVPVKKKGRKERRAERPRRSFATMFMIVLVLAAAGTGAWWTIQSGILLTPEERDNSVPNPPRLLESENFSPDRPRGPGGFQDNEKSSLSWITIFEPANSTEVSVPAGTDATLVERDGQNYLRVRAAGDAGVRFDVGHGTLERIAGETVLFSISARGEEGMPIQFAVGCDLAELGNCGRKRYEAGSTLAEFLFEIEVPRDKPSRSGSLTIDPDISNSGFAIDIREIRVAISD